MNSLNYQVFEHRKVAMSGRLSIVGCLTNLRVGTLILLTLVSFTTHRLHPTYADATKGLSAEEDARLSNAKDYLRKQGMRSLSVLPGSLREDFDRLAKGWHPLAEDESDSGGDNASANLADTHTTTKDIPLHLPFDFHAQYHHKGFLPTHDALIMGAIYTQTFADRKMRVDVKPFYGQSWLSFNHYWGGEVSLDLAQRADDLPWGHLTLGYVSGKNNLTDHGTGIDMHGDIDLTEGWTFTSGVRQDPISGDSNYVLLKWRLGL